MSLSRRKEVVRKCRPPIPPEQPRTLSRTLFSLFLVERRHAVPVGRRRLAALFRYFFRIHLVELAGGIHALQIEQAYLDLIPLLRAVMPQRLVPQPQLVVRVLVHFGLEPDRLVNGHRFVLALHLDAVDLAEYDVPDGVARGFADQDADAVALGAALEARGDVDRIAHRRVRAPHLRPHVPDPHGAGIHADADLERRPAARGELGVQPLALALHLDGGEHAVARVLHIVNRRAPERHDLVADVLVERAAVLAADDGAHVRKVFVDVLAQLVGLERLGNAGESAHVGEQDRKSTRLNSSHGYISYAVFCLKKKKKSIKTPDVSIKDLTTIQQTSSSVV